MTVPATLWQVVRQRAGFACEFCRVRESDVGGELTVDHFQPTSRGGDDNSANLIYCCPRCNLYKADYWPDGPSQPPLWNPRSNAADQHFVSLSEGSLAGLTPTGRFTITRLRLNRPQLLEYRRRRRLMDEQTVSQSRLKQVVVALEEMCQQHSSLLVEQQRLLQQYRDLLEMLRQPNH